MIVRGLRAESFAVDLAFDGNSGWEMAANVNYDLIILDLMLPGMHFASSGGGGGGFHDPRVIFSQFFGTANPFAAFGGGGMRVLARA